MITIMLFAAYCVLLALDTLVYACVVAIAGPRRNFWPLSGFYELVKLAKQRKNIDTQ